MRHRSTFVLASLLLATSISPSLVAQEQHTEAPAKADLEIPALVKLANVRLDKAIGIALKARPGVAAAAELEGTADDGEVVPFFEVMIFGKDQAVYEVRVHAGNGKVLANEACHDEEDVGEVKAVAQEEHVPSLSSVVAETQALLRGTCVRAELLAKEHRADAIVLNRGHQVCAQFRLADGHLLGVQWLPAKGKAAEVEHAKGAREESDEEREEEGEKQEGTEKAGKAKNDKKAKGRSTEAGEENEEEGEEEGEEHKGAEKAGKTKNDKKAKGRGAEAGEENEEEGEEEGEEHKGAEKAGKAKNDKKPDAKKEQKEGKEREVKAEREHRAG